MAAKREKRQVFVEDESIFSLKPYTRRGWYPKGPAVHVPMTYGSSRFYAFGVANGKKEHYLFFDSKNKKKTQGKKKKKNRNIDEAMTIEYLTFLHKLHPRLLLIWDEGSNHTAKTVQDYAQNHDIKLAWFPTACPDENPMEQAWDALKEATANDYHPTINEYKKAVKREVHKKDLTKMFKYLIF